MSHPLDLTRRRYGVTTAGGVVVGEETHHFRVDPSDRRLLTQHSTLHISRDGAAMSMVGSFTLDIETLGLVRARYRFGDDADEVQVEVDDGGIVVRSGATSSTVVAPAGSVIVPSYVAPQLPALLDLRDVDRFTCIRFAEGPMTTDGTAVLERRNDDPAVWEQRVSDALATVTHLHPTFGVTMIDYGSARAVRTRGPSGPDGRDGVVGRRTVRGG